MKYAIWNNFTNAWRMPSGNVSKDHDKAETFDSRDDAAERITDIEMKIEDAYAWDMEVRKIHK